jgi:hypothetical protein
MLLILTLCSHLTQATAKPPLVGEPRPGEPRVDVNAAHKAVGAALAGLDLTTTKAQLDASKAAAAQARANGEIPPPRQASLRSVSCRQLGAPSKAVSFDEGSTGVRAKPDGLLPTGLPMGPPGSSSLSDGQRRPVRR